MAAKQQAEEILTVAVKKQASDIFIFSDSKKYEIKLRTNTGLEKLGNYKLDEGIELINYLKFISQMDIAEHRRPQVGAYSKIIDKEKVYLRFSSVGDFLNYESVVIRLIYAEHENNYFFSEQIELLASLCQKRGLIITSGPTGSGKTSTMYELARLAGKNKVVMTIEDPVEILEPKFLQTQVNSTAGITYLDLLKAALRNRPDILIIGEIRDSETAKVAVNAALSGHLVLATVHAKSSLQTLSRLEGLGISKSELYNALSAVSYQRLLLDKEKESLSCLFDIASGKQLRDQIDQVKRGDFISWKNSLQILRKEGKISEATFDAYQEG